MFRLRIKGASAKVGEKVINGLYVAVPEIIEEMMYSILKKYTKAYCEGDFINQEKIEALYVFSEDLMSGCKLIKKLANREGVNKNYEQYADRAYYYLRGKPDNV